MIRLLLVVGRASVLLLILTGLATVALAQESPVEEGEAPGTEVPAETADPETADPETADPETATEEPPAGVVQDSQDEEEAEAEDKAQEGAIPKCLIGAQKRAEAEADKAEAETPEPGKTESVDAVRQGYIEAVDRYAKAAFDYQTEVHKVLKRSVDEQRDFVDRTYGKQGEDLEGEERQKRDEAIRRFERFVQTYPANAEYTPDAMFRLAELYFERSEVRFSDGLAQYDKDRSLYDRGRIPSEPRVPERDMGDSVRIYRTLLSRFGDTYRYADAVYYLLGYVQNESAEDDEALEAWETLVKRFPQSEFAPETLLRIGETYFDYGDFDKAGRYYKRAMAYKDSGYYDKALYKLGWTYFQRYDYDAAINGFLELISYYDNQRSEGGATASALRDEAVEYLALSLAEDDWDNDGLPDENAGVKRALSYVSSGKPYEWDIIERYGKALVDLADEKKWREAIQVYKHLIKLNKLAANAPRFQEEIIRLHDVLRETEKAYAARQQLAKLFGPESEWWERNRAEVKLQDQIASSILDARKERAMFLDQQARDLLAQAKMELNADKLAQSQNLFREAASEYRNFIKDYPYDEDVYDLTMYQAESLWNSGQYAVSAAVYERITKDWDDGEYASVAAWKWIKSRERILTKLASDGIIDPKVVPGSEWEPPEPEEEEETEGQEDVENAPEQNVQLEEEEVPEASVKWILAVQYFLDQDVKVEGVPDAAVTLAYQVGELMYRLNRLDDARSWFKQVISCYPKHEAAADAVAQIINSYNQQKDFDNLEKWGNLAEELELGDPEQVASVRAAIRTFKLGAQFRKADKFMREEKFLDAAREFERLADENPDITYADKAYFNAAMAYKKVKYYDSAARILERLVTEDRFSESGFLEESLSVLAETYKQFFSFDKAIVAFRTLYTRYREAEDDERRYRLAQIAKLQEAAGNYREAALGYEAYVAAYPTREEAGLFLYKAGGLYSRLDDYKNERRIWKAFTKKYKKTDGLENKKTIDEWVIEAHGKLRDIAMRVGDRKATKRIEDQILKEYEARNDAPEGTLAWYGEVGSKPAELVAGILFRRLDWEWKKYKKIRATSSNPKKVGAAIKAKLASRQDVEAKYFKLIPYSSLEWTIAVAYRTAQLYDDFAEMLLNVPEPEGLSEDEMDEYQVMIEDLATPIEDKAIQLYERAVVQARKFKVKNIWARLALESINKYKPTEYPVLRELKTEEIEDSLYTVDARSPEASQ